MKKNAPLGKKITEEVLLSIPEAQFHTLYLEVKSIINDYEDKYEKKFLLGEFIKKDYDLQLKNRFNSIKKKYGELNYNVLNKDKIVKDLRNKQHDKASIRESLRVMGENYNLTEYNITLEALPLIIDVKWERKLKKYKKNNLFIVFDEIYDKVISSLHLPTDKKVKYTCFTLFLDIWNKLKRGTKLRGPQNLSPIIIFMFFNMKGRNLTIKNITDTIHISDKDMRHGLKEIIKVYPQYLEKDKKLLALNRIKQIQAKFRLPTEFSPNSKAIMEKLWSYISNTTEDVIAGTVCVLTVIAMDLNEYNYSQICKNIGIAPSTVIYQIRNKLFKRLHISGFQSVVKSREMIKELIMKNVNIKIPKK